LRSSLDCGCSSAIPPPPPYRRSRKGDKGPVGDVTKAATALAANPELASSDAWNSGGGLARPQTLVKMRRLGLISEVAALGHAVIAVSLALSLLPSPSFSNWSHVVPPSSPCKVKGSRECMVWRLSMSRTSPFCQGKATRRVCMKCAMSIMASRSRGSPTALGSLLSCNPKVTEDSGSLRTSDQPVYAATSCAKNKIYESKM